MLPDSLVLTTLLTLLWILHSIDCTLIQSATTLIALKFSWDRLEDGRVESEFPFWILPKIGESVQ